MTPPSRHCFFEDDYPPPRPLSRAPGEGGRLHRVVLDGDEGGEFVFGGEGVEVFEVLGEEGVEGGDVGFDALGEVGEDVFGDVGGAVVAELDGGGEADQFVEEAGAGVDGVAPTLAEVGDEEGFFDVKNLVAEGFGGFGDGGVVVFGAFGPAVELLAEVAHGVEGFGGAVDLAVDAEEEVFLGVEILLRRREA